VNFEIDTTAKNHHPKIHLNIEDQIIRTEDSTTTASFKLYKISKVNVYTDHNANNANTPIKDSVNYNNFTLYSINKLKYKPKAITDGIL
jgi:hypothetical protein